MKYKINICHLYPDLMNLYGDKGNITCLLQRCKWRNIDVAVHSVGLGSMVDFRDFDILFMGGGQDKEQMAICEDFRMVKGTSLATAVEEGVPFLSICGGYQLLGKYYLTHDGRQLPGVGVLDVWTEGGGRRLIGNVAVRANENLLGSGRTLAGFENHSGRTYLGPGVAPLGTVLAGYGNNGRDGTEGAVYRNAIGTYLHGCLLPKNPWLADHLITMALRRKYKDAGILLSELDDAVERLAHDHAIIIAKRKHRLRG